MAKVTTYFDSTISNNSQKRKQQIDSLLSCIEVFSLTVKKAEVATSIRAQLERAGTLIGAYDILIAGIVLSSHAT